jgi:hypothetical protein
VSFKAKGKIQSEPFELSGNYLVSFSTLNDCAYFVDAVSTSTGFSTDLWSADTKMTGETYVYGIESGSYYFKAITGAPPMCPWDMKLTPID